MDIQRTAAFSHDACGGNPAGVVLLDAPMDAAGMARIAAEVGYSETAFAVRTGEAAITGVSATSHPSPRCRSAAT